MIAPFFVPRGKGHMFLAYVAEAKPLSRSAIVVSQLKSAFCD